jgi:signal peptidase I
MKKLNIAIAVVFIGLLIGYYVARYTGALVPYKTASSANEPNFKVGGLVWVSNQKTPQMLDYVQFRDMHPYYKTVENYQYRVCGLAGDKVEIRAAVLYVNGQNIDKNLVLKHGYLVPKFTATLLEQDGITTKGENIEKSMDSTLVFLSEQQIKDNKIKDLKRFILSESDAHETVKDVFKHDWNPDNFGPITVPKDHYFLLGDNRENAMDSRYWGFIAKEKIVGTIVFKIP